MEINHEFVYRKFPKTEHDVQLLDEYKQRIGLDQPEPLNLKLDPAAPFPGQLWEVFPVDETTPDNDGHSPLLSLFGFLALSIDSTYVNGFLAPACRALMAHQWPQDFLQEKEVRLLRTSLLEFALLGNRDAQHVLWKLDEVYGPDDDYITPLVEKRCPGLRRFVSAQQGTGLSTDLDSFSITYSQALEEVRSGVKKSHWIWYIFPEFKHAGTHSPVALHYCLADRKEAFGYICHPLLRAHLVEVCQAVLDSPKLVYSIFGNDTMKVKSCVRLFASVCDIPVFRRIIAKYKWN